MSDDILILFVQSIWSIIYIAFMIGGVIIPIWMIVSVIQYIRLLAKGKNNTNFRFPPW